MWELILGGLTGLIGSSITAWTNYKTQKLKNDHDIAMVEAETNAMIAETKANIEITKTQTEADVEMADTEAYSKGIVEGNKGSFSEKWINKLFGVKGWLSFLSIPTAIMLSVLFGLVDFLKGLMRPGLTMYLVGMTTWITMMAWEIMNQNQVTITAEQAYNIFTDVINIVIYLTVSCVTWWFADRRIAKFLMRLKDGNSKS